MSQLALLGGSKEIPHFTDEIFKWPVVSADHEKAVLDVVRAGKMSQWDITTEFEQAFAKEFHGDYGLMCNNGTSAIHSGFYGLGIGVGDEVICPSMTYWASVLQVYSLGATPVFAEVDPYTLCISPEDFEACITKRTKAVVVVHYGAMPADMDAIMAIARNHQVKVFEDCSHAHASLYKGRLVGTFGQAAGYSLMSGKSFAIGEAGILLTNDKEVYERAVLFGHYERAQSIELPSLKKYAGLPCGGYKYRVNQASSAYGLVELKQYKEKFAEIDLAMNYFCDIVDALPGIKTVRPAKASGSSKGGWYCPMAHYDSSRLEGLSLSRFAEAVQAENGVCIPGCNKPLHAHPLLTEMDVYGHGRPTRMANLPEGIGLDELQKPLPITQTLNDRVFRIPSFRKFNKAVIEQHAEVYRKVIRNYKDLLAGDMHSNVQSGYSATFRTIGRATN